MLNALSGQNDKLATASQADRLRELLPNRLSAHLLPMLIL